MQAPAYGGSTYLGAGALDVTTDGLATVGDMGHVDADGYLYLADRRVDMIISGGANVFPAEVEAALIDHPAVADVVVIGLRDPEWGQRVHAIIEVKDGRRPAVLRRRHRVRQVPPRGLQGAEDRRDRRHHPPQCGHEGQPRRPRRRTRFVNVEALFVPDGDHTFVPTTGAVGPWNRDVLHGAAVAALFAGRLTPTDRLLGRLTVELLAPVPFAPLQLDDQHGRRRSTRATAAGDAERRGARRGGRPVGHGAAGRPRPAGRGHGAPRPVRVGPGAVA